MRYLVSYPTGVLGLKPKLEEGDELHAEVPDDFLFQPGKDYIVYSDGTYEAVDKVEVRDDDNVDLSEEVG